MGTAIALPAATGMIGTTYPAGKKRTWAFVTVTCGTSQSIRCPRGMAPDILGGVSGGSAGMLIAGAFLEYSRYVCCRRKRFSSLVPRWTWRPCFLLIGLVSLWPWTIVTWLAPSDPPHIRRAKLDWLGSLFMGLSLFLLLFGFTSSQTETRGWKTPCKLTGRSS